MNATEALNKKMKTAEGQQSAGMGYKLLAGLYVSPFSREFPDLNHFLSTTSTAVELYDDRVSDSDAEK